MLRFVLTCMAMVTVCAWSGTAAAGPVLDRVKASGVVHCGSVERPGLAQIGADGQWHGLNVDVCRAVAAAVLGSADHIAFHEYETPAQFDMVRKGADDLFFLTATEMNREGLAGQVVPGPTVFVESHAVLVPKSSKTRHLKDLAGSGICFMIGSPVERSLNAALSASGMAWFPMGYSEDGEMVDAYNVQRCKGVAYETTTLATVARDGGINRRPSRMLPERLAVFPIMAATGTGDGQWSAIVAWTVHTLVSAERPETPWYAGGAAALPVKAPELGLDAGWQKRVVDAVGHFGQIFERNVGKPLNIARGPNANQMGGGLMLSPFLE